MTGTIAFQVRRDDLADTRIADITLDPAPGQAVLRVDQFALTANTVTYGVHGVSLKYWDFYPAADGWGLVPAWGTATVNASRAAALKEGDRLYGYMTFAGAVLFTPEATGQTGILDTTAHRAHLPKPYNRYRRWDATMGDERLTGLLQPLHATSFLLDDFLAENAVFGAEAVLLSSASSKTALAAAHAIGQRATRPRLIGLTSERNLAFTRATRAYDEVIPYAEITARDAAQPTLYLDFAGDRALRTAVHTHWADRLAYSCAVGDTHQGLGKSTGPLAGPKPVFFFAPDWLGRRQADWGAGAAAARLDTAWTEFARWSAGWLRVVEEHGPEAVARRWAEALAGGTPPDVGVVLSLP